MFESGRAGDRTHRRQDLPIYSPVTYPLDHRAFDKDAMFFQLYICNIHILIYYNVYTHSLHPEIETRDRNEREKREREREKKIHRRLGKFHEG